MKRAERRHKESVKYKKRLRLYKVDDIPGWQKKLKNHSTLCSCFGCSHSKYDRAKVKKIA